MHFVDQMVPEDVTDISTIKDMLEEYEVEEEVSMKSTRGELCKMIWQIK